VRAAEQDLAVVGDRHLGPGQRPAHRAEPHRVDRVDRGRGAALGQPVALEHEHAAGVEEFEQLGRDRCGPDQRDLELGPEQAPDLGQHHAVGRAVLDVGQ